MLISRKSPLIQVYHTRSIAEKEKEYTESQKINELSEFRMIQAVIKCFEKDQQSRELRRFRTCPAVYLYDVNTAIIAK